MVWRCHIVVTYLADLVHEKLRAHSTHSTPGAFGLMATPLAQASNASNTTNFTRQPPSTKSDVVDLSALQSASQVLLEQLAKDAQIIPDVGETLTTRMS